MGFDPTNFNPKDNGGNRANELLKAGTYILWAKSFKRKQSNGKEQILFICDPILTANLERIPKDTYQPVFETCTLTAEAAWRLGALSQAVGRETPFNAMSDREVGAVFKFKPFKAVVKRSTYNGKEQVKLDNFLALTAADEQAAEEVLEDLAVDNATGGGYEDEDSGYRGNTNGAPPIDVDDLPF